MPNLKPLLHGNDDPKELLEAVVQALHGDHYYHHRFIEVLGTAGFDVSTAEQHWFHHIYEIRMKVGHFDLDRDTVRAARQIRRVLKKAGFYIEPDAIQLVRYGERLKLVFVFPFGAEGIVRAKR